MNWWEEPIWALDLETTGTDPHTCEIVQCGLARVHPNGRVLEQHAAIVHAESWSVEAEAIHGITRAENEYGVHEDVAQDMLDYVVFNAQSPMVVFNAPYDLTILERYDVDTSDLLVLDPLVLDKACVLKRSGKGARKLGALAAHYGVEPGPAHDALGDAITAARLAFALARKHESLRVPARELHEQQVSWAAEQASSLQAYFRKSDPAARVEGAWPVIPHEAQVQEQTS